MLVTYICMTRQQQLGNFKLYLSGKKQPGYGGKAYGDRRPAEIWLTTTLRTKVTDPQGIIKVSVATKAKIR